MHHYPPYRRRCRVRRARCRIKTRNSSAAASASSAIRCDSLRQSVQPKKYASHPHAMFDMRIFIARPTQFALQFLHGYICARCAVLDAGRYVCVCVCVLCSHKAGASIIGSYSGGGLLWRIQAACFAYAERLNAGRVHVHACVCICRKASCFRICIHPAHSIRRRA